MADNKSANPANVVVDADGKRVELPVHAGSLGPECIDIGKLYKETGKFTYDPGFMSTASCRSAITYIDGDAGVLMYRGYPIEQLAKSSNFLEVSYLLMHGELPDQKQFGAFEHEVTHHTMMHEAFRTFLYGFRHDAHPMAMMTGMIGSLAAFYHGDLNLEDPEQRRLAAIRLLAKVPTIAAACYRYSIGWPIRYPRNNLEYVDRFLHMMFEVPSEPLELNPVAAKALDLLFILHADHEQNASTSTVRLAGSSGANPFACIASGIACLWGPAHGGANEAALQMLIDLQKEGGVAKIGEFVKKVKDKNSGVKLMGFGHRVYKNYDPRAKLMQETTREVLAAVGAENDPLLPLAMALEKIALEDEYFVSRKLYPNVDFYSGIVQRALGIPTSMFTCIFALARTVGWIAQWNEMISDPEQKIGRPRQLYIGPAQRDVVPLAKRK